MSFRHLCRLAALVGIGLIVAPAARAQNNFTWYKGNGSYCASAEYRGMCGPGGNAFTGDHDWGVAYCRGMAQQNGCPPLTDLRFSSEKAGTPTPPAIAAPAPQSAQPQFTHWATTNELDWQGNLTYKVYVQNQANRPLTCSVTINYDQTQFGKTQSFSSRVTIAPAAYATDSGGLSGTNGVAGASIVGRGYQITCKSRR